MEIKKIGIDFHGVINTDPDFFRDFSQIISQHDIEIHIISGGPRDKIIQYLQEHSIRYDKVWCIFDYYRYQNKVSFLPDGSFYVDDVLWDRAKAQYCQREKINLHIDDSDIYGRYFTTGYCLYNASAKSGNINNVSIKFFQSPEKVFDALIKLCV